jgi:hypothetical protein
MDGDTTHFLVPLFVDFRVEALGSLVRVLVFEATRGPNAWAPGLGVCRGAPASLRGL